MQTNSLDLPLICLPHWLDAKSTKLDTLYYPLSLYSAGITNKRHREVYSIDACGIASCSPSLDRLIRFVNTENLWSEDIEVFESHYIHLSSNHNEFEMKCFVRMFFLRNLLRMLCIDEALVIESDVLLFGNLTPLAGQFKGNCDAALTEMKCPATSYITIDYAEHFCDVVLRAYTDTGISKNISTIYEINFSAKGKKGGIYDMTFNHWISKNSYSWGKGIKIRDSASIFNEDAESFTSDSRITKLNHGSTMFHKMEHYFFSAPIKKVIFQSGASRVQAIPNNENITLLSGHYQGGSKVLMSSHFTSFVSTFTND